MTTVKADLVVEKKFRLVPKLAVALLMGCIIGTSSISSFAPPLEAHAVDFANQNGATTEEDVDEDEDVGASTPTPSASDAINNEKSSDLNVNNGGSTDSTGGDTLGFDDEETQSAGSGDALAGGKTGEEKSTISVKLTSEDAAALSTALKEGLNSSRYDVVFKSTAPQGAKNSGDKLIKMGANGDTVTLNKDAFTYGTDASVKEALSYFVSDLQNSSVSEQGQQDIMDTWSEADSNINKILIPITIDKTSADIYTAMKWLNPFLPIIRVILGVLAILIVVLVILSTTIDLMFIGLPIARERMQGSGDKKAIPFVSNDAVYAVNETASSLSSSGGYKNAYFTYFKHRAMTYVLLSICVLYLVLGELSGLIAWLLTLGDGVVKQ